MLTDAVPVRLKLIRADVPYTDTVAKPQNDCQWICDGTKIVKTPLTTPIERSRDRESETLTVRVAHLDEIGCGQRLNRSFRAVVFTAA